jgi:uroporphyrinogen-III synthase
MRLLVTRPEPEAEETAARLTAMGHEAMLQPMLRIVFAPPPEGLPVPAALIATSRNGVRALAAWPAATTWRKTPLFVTGEGTARIAAEAGFTDVRPGGADAAALANRIVRDLVKGDAPILYAAARDRTGALAGGLTAAGYDVRTVEAYRADLVTGFDPAVAEAFRAGRIDGILFYSRRTAAAFVAAVEAAGLAETVRGVACYALSDRVAEPLRALAPDIRVAARPDFGSLMALIDKPVASGAPV